MMLTLIKVRIQARMMTIEMEKNRTVLLFLLGIKLLVRIRLMETSKPATLSPVMTAWVYLAGSMQFRP